LPRTPAAIYGITKRTSGLSAGDQYPEVLRLCRVEVARTIRKWSTACGDRERLPSVLVILDGKTVYTHGLQEFIEEVQDTTALGYRSDRK